MLFMIPIKYLFLILNNAPFIRIYQKSILYHFFRKLYRKVKLVTVVEGDPKAPFSIATTPRGRWGHFSFPWTTPLYSWSVPYSAEY